MTDGHPILFSPPMVRVLLSGAKTQTRRVVKDLDKLSVFLPFRVKGDWPIGHHIEAHSGPHKAHLNPHGAVSVKGTGGQLLGLKPSEFQWICPLGNVGEKLWVREAWRVGKPHDKRSGNEIWEHLKGTGKQGVTVLYEAGGLKSVSPFNRPDEPLYPDDVQMPSWAGRKRSSMFMPRWASRISLRIIDVRLQRLQDISGADCEAEGVLSHIAEYSRDKVYRDQREEKAKQYFRELWDSINKAKHPWSENSWVWAITFSKL